MSRPIARRHFLQSVASSTVAIAGLHHPSHGAFHAQTRLDRVGDYVEATMAKWGVPGLALAVVRDGKLIVAEGFGVRAIGAAAKIDAETLFPMASCTKGFTAAAIAKLVDHRKVHWDDPIVRHLPEFQLSDPQLTAAVTIRQALAHRTGLPTANMLWRRGDFRSDEIIERLRWLSPVAAPGEKFLYNNNLYLVVGKIAERVSGRTWKEFVGNELLKLLGMRATIVDGTELRGHDNLAAPHATDTGTLQCIPRHCPDVIAPAGAIHSNVLDMARWLQMQLSGGQFEDRQVLTAARIAEMHTPPPADGAKPVAAGVPRAPITRYGLGWFFNEFAGRTVIEHSGTQSGFVAWVAMIPEEKLGLVVLANHHRTGLNSALRSWIFDACLGRPEKEWSESVRADYANGYQRLLREAKDRFDAQRPAATGPSRPNSAYTGDYESPLYGRVNVTDRDGQLRLQFGTRFDGKLQPWGGDTFRAYFPNPRLDDWRVTFATSHERVTGLRIKEAPWAPDWYDDADDLGEFRHAGVD